MTTKVCPLEACAASLTSPGLMPETVMQVSAILEELRPVAALAAETGLAGLARQYSPLFRALPDGRRGFIAALLNSPVIPPPPHSHPGDTQ
jgi:hypothetical protein